MSCLCLLDSFEPAPAKIERICRGDKGGARDVERILRRNAELNLNSIRYENEEYTALHIATIHVNPGVVEALLESERIDAEAYSTQARYTALHLSSWKGELEIASLLCEKGLVSLEQKSREGFTALHYACWSGSVEMCDYLIAVGANTKVANKHGYTPLLLAARAGNEEVVNTLLEKNEVDKDECDIDGSTALHHACYEGHRGVVTILLKRGASHALKDKLGRTPRDLCKTRELADLLDSLYKSSSPQKRSTFKLRLSPPRPEGTAPAGLAHDTVPVQSGVPHLGAAYLASLPPPPGTIGFPKASPTHQPPLAAGGGESSEEKEGQMDPYRLPDRGPEGVGLHVAPKVAQECWRLCSSSGDAGALKRLLNAYTGLTHGQPSPLYHLRDTDNWSLVMRAASKGYLDVVKVLLSIDPESILTTCDHGWGPLHRAAGAGHVSMVDLLLSITDKSGTPMVMVDSKTKQGSTALMKAAEFGHVEVARSLILKGADENEKDKEGFTPLHLAAMYAHRDVLIFLVTDCQANPLAMTAEGDLPEDFTRSKSIRSLLRAVQFHHSMSSGFGGSPTAAQEIQLAQAWRAVELCTEQLMQHPGVPARGSDRLLRSESQEAVETSTLAGKGRSAKSSVKGSLKKTQPTNPMGSPASVRGHPSDMGTEAAYDVKLSAKTTAMRLIDSARSKKGKGRPGSPRTVEEQMASFTPKRASPLATTTVTGLHSAKKKRGTPTSPASLMSPTSPTSPTSPEMHIMTLRERLKAKYRKLEEAKGEGDTEKDGGLSENKEDEVSRKMTPSWVTEGGNDESEDSDVDDIESDPHHVKLASPASLQRRLLEKREKRVFTKVAAEDVDALAAMSMAQDVMLAGDEKVKESKLLSKTRPETTQVEMKKTHAVERVDTLDDVKATRKEMKGSLLLTMILTQVYNVYANKISRAFYRWKHRYGSESVMSASKSPVKDR